MNLNEIMQAAQGGQGIDNLASQFGLSPEQTQAAIQAVIPAFSKGLQGATQDPSSLGGILSHLASGAHEASYTDPDQASAASSQGGDVLGQIFGSSGVTAPDQPAGFADFGRRSRDHPADDAGHRLDVDGRPHPHDERTGPRRRARPARDAATTPGGIGSATNPAGAAPQSGGLLGGLFSSVMGALTGGGAAGSTSELAAIQAALNSLTGMLHSGVQAPPEHHQALDDIMNPGK